MEFSHDLIKELNCRASNYADIRRVLVSAKNRLKSLPGNKDLDIDASLDPYIRSLESSKDALSRKIGKDLAMWPIWEEWLANVRGIGPDIASNLVLRYYCRFVAICEECGASLARKEAEGEEKKGALLCPACGKKAKGEGNLVYKIERRDFPTISKWWAYMGMHTVDGKKPMRRAGVASNWNNKGRATCYQIGEQFNRQSEDHLYKKLLLERKAKHEKNHPEWSKGHIHNAAKNEAVKVFLSHFWQVAHEIDGLPVTEPYAGTILGHTNISRPFYWEPAGA